MQLPFTREQFFDLFAAYNAALWPAWEKVLISALPKTKFDHEPGTRYLYSNIGYAILGAALARAAGQPFIEYVEQKIFAPLGMTHTAFEPNDTIRPLIAKGYAVRRVGPTGAAGAATPAPAVDAETPAREHDGRGYKVPNGAMTRPSMTWQSSWPSSWALMCRPC